MEPAIQKSAIRFKTNEHCCSNRSALLQQMQHDAERNAQ